METNRTARISATLLGFALLAGITAAPASAHGSHGHHGHGHGHHQSCYGWYDQYGNYHRECRW